MNSTRSWGDGAGHTAAHIIADISYSLDPMFVICENDGVRIEARTSGGLDRAWDLHRGLTVATIMDRQSRRDLATDGEVSDFLKRIEGEPRYMSHYGPGVVSQSDDGLEDAFALLDRLQEAGRACACTTDDVVDCPNYIEGDEND